MRLLLDTQLLIWSGADAPGQLSREARLLLEDTGNDLVFSVASIWEVAIKCGLRRDGFLTDPAILRRVLLDNAFTELNVEAEHAIGVARLPVLHKDPFDRLLISQAMAEGLILLTTDRKVADYPGPIRLV